MIGAGAEDASAHCPRLRWQQWSADLRSGAFLRKLNTCRAGGRRSGAVCGCAQEATMTLKWMAARLKMGTWTYVAKRLYHLKKQTCDNTQDQFNSI